MRCGFGLLALTSLVLAACGSSAGKRAAPKSNPSTPTTTGTARQPVYFQGAVGAAAQRPTSLELTGDGTLAVEDVQWASWGGSKATGTGNAKYHGCTPNCAQAPVQTALVSIRLFGVRVCSGRRYYSGITLTLNSGQLLDKSFLQRSWSPC